MYDDKFDLVKRFLEANHNLRPGWKGYEYGSEEYWERLNNKFINGRKPKELKAPRTVTDPVVDILMQKRFGHEESAMARIQKEHGQAMVVESSVGDTLERFLARELEPYDWVWCSGEVVKHVDFIQTKGDVSEWIPVQIKNRDNSENSSSSKVRKNTGIIMWFRTYSQTGKTNWENFPGAPNNARLSEEDFQEFYKIIF